MLLLVVYIVFGAFQVCSSKILLPRHNLCKVGEPLTSPEGIIYFKHGRNCNRVILAPVGYRIEVNVTIQIRIRRQVYVYVYDGATRYDTDKRSFYRYGSTITVSTSNAVLIHINRLNRMFSFPVYVEIIYKMFQQNPKRCLCWPVSHGNNVCSFPTITYRLFYEKDALYKKCTVFCDQDHFLTYGTSRKDYQMKCWMAERRYVKYGESNKWKLAPSSGAIWAPPLLDHQPLTCARIFPATRVKLGYKIIYSDVSCADVNETIFQEKIREYVSSIETVASAGECFKHPNVEENINCTVESVNVTCVENKRSTQVILIVRDNIVNSTNETLEYQRFSPLFSAFFNDIDSYTKPLDEFIDKNLTVKKKKAVDITRIYNYEAMTDCPNNSGSKRDYLQDRFGCLKCPLHFYKDDSTSFFTCQECKNGTRRNNDETRCVRGPRSYPMPKIELSQKNCKHTCRLGKFYNANSSICEWCPYGSYQNSTTALDPVCTPCPDGLTTGFVGARNISECIQLCPAGSYLKYTKCVQCDVGYFMPNADNRLEKCHRCKRGFTTLGVATTAGCVKRCSSGKYFNMTIRECSKCPKNTYQDVGYAFHFACKKCPANTITATTGSTMKYDCLGPCSSGEFLDVSLRKCSSCPRNTYQEEAQHANLRCKSCGAYKITKSIASADISDCISLICDKNEFFNLTSKSCKKCTNTSQGEIGCPVPKTIPLPTQAPLTTTKSTVVSEADLSKNDHDNIGLIVGVVFGVLTCCIIVAVVVVFWWIKRKNTSHTFGSSSHVIQLLETH